MFNAKKVTDDKGNNQLTSLSNHSIIKGDCSIEGDLRIDGTVEGNIQCTGKIVIGPEGKIKGNIRCAHACLHGTIVGDAYVKDEFTLKANSVMLGNIYTAKLEIEAQAKFNGACHTNDENHEIKLLEAVVQEPTDSKK